MTLSASDRRIIISIIVFNATAWVLRFAIGGEEGRALASGIFVGAILFGIAFIISLRSRRK